MVVVGDREASSSISSCIFKTPDRLLLPHPLLLRFSVDMMMGDEQSDEDLV